MKSGILTLVAVLIGLQVTASSAIAGPATDALVNCVADNTTGKDRKDMARWIFVVMSAHPEIQKLSNVSETDREQVDRTMAAIATRLLTENCQAQAKLAMQTEADSAPLQTAFGEIGKLAMQELMSNPVVSSATESFGKYLDEDKLSAAFK